MILLILIKKIGMIIKRGGIYFARLDPVEGSEINKTRPVLVVSNDINNQYFKNNYNYSHNIKYKSYSFF